MNARFHFRPRTSDHGPRVVSRSGFSLVEILAAMVVLSVIVLIVARIFSGSSAALEAGTRRMDNNLIARGTLEFFSRELSQAVADRRVYLKVEEGAGPAWEGAASDTINFVSLNSKAEYRSGKPYRDVQQIQYAVEAHTDGRLMFTRRVTEDESSTYFTAYALAGNQWWSTMGGAWPNEIAMNVANFRVNVFNTNMVYRAAYDSELHGPPLYADVYFSVLDESDALRAVGMASRAAYVTQKARRYATRVYFMNRFEDQP
jgi:prepilin-type N-terminal cleavage/methylation domain-containing protein